ncbi:MAG TPA: family 78 glycoside hydrolase catalytic domain [Clostridiales bacterium]|nr:family 78 glycoside hydrolase catalytic domain [Clostridiales bacterium]
MLKVYDLKCCYRKNPIGIGERSPEFSWKIDSDQRNVLQLSYRIQTSRSDSFEEVLWDSGVVESDRSIHVDYAGPELESRTRYFYRVRIEDNRKEESDWSVSAWFETGLLDSGEWQAEFISADREEQPAYSPACPYFRKSFAVTGKIASARAYVTCLGLYELRLNGQKVGNYFLTPGWTDYRKRLQYQTYDITSLLKPGTNAVGVILGNGWYKGPVAGWEEHPTEKYGARTALLSEIHITYQDGRHQVIATDESWKTSLGPILKSEIYDGEQYDAEKEMENWDCADYNDSRWNSVYPVKVGKDILVAQENIPVMQAETILPVKLFKTPQGDSVLDFGQNMVGWVRFRVKGPKGSRVVLQHAEVLDSTGNFYTENLRSAKQVVEYVLKGSGEEIFEPHFTYQGFRYVRVAEYPGEIKLENFEGVVLHSGMEKTGDFACSEELVNKLQHNILWGQKGNFVDIPTDCPQRDERLGWTGDAQIFARTACYNMDTALFFKKWLRDLKADQLPDGQVPFVVPQVMKDTDYSSSGWGDAAVICPWQIYLCYGDQKVLEEQYLSMKGWVEYIRSQANHNLWDTGFHFGDWLALDKTNGSRFNGLLGHEDKQDNYFGATPNDYVSTAFYAYSVSLLAKAAGVLGRKGEQAEYTALHQDIIKSFRYEYFTRSGRLAVHTQTAHVLALMFDLVEEKYVGRTVKELLSMLEDNFWHLDTGFLGTPYLCHVLSRYGHPEAAYRLLMQTDYPSWLYQVTKGATTVWEHWDGLKPDGSFWSADMNSFNHYAYGSIGSWLYQVAAGIEIDENQPGYKHIIIRPTPDKTFSWVNAEHETPYGTVSIKWKIRDGKFRLELLVPHNTTATVVLPDADLAGLTMEPQASQVKAAEGQIVVECGSGRWNYCCNFTK